MRDDGLDDELTGAAETLRQMGEDSHAALIERARAALRAAWAAAESHAAEADVPAAVWMHAA